MKKIFIYGKGYDNYARALNDAGAQAVISENAELSRECDGLLLPGGGDVSPCFYNSAERFCTGVDLKRDCAEQYLIAVFLRQNKPIMGVCRGMQMLNVYFRGTLEQKIRRADMHYAAGTDVYHPIFSTQGGFTYKLFGEKFTVNSAHKQAVKIVGAGLKICARAPDGTIEAIQNLNKKIVAVQFHPERMENRGNEIYEYFLSLF